MPNPPAQVSTEAHKYRFSFTAGSLMLREMVVCADALVENGCDLNSLDPHLLNKEKSKTTKRTFSEVKLRLAELTQDELYLLHSAEHATQRLMCFLACCRAYGFIYDFVHEVLVEKVLVFDHQINDRDYNAFINRKAVDHPELDEITDLTKEKIKQVVFKVLEQASLIDSVKSRVIQVPLLNTRLELLLKSSRPADLVLLLQTQYV